MVKAIVSVTRTYTKQVQLEVDVPDDVEDIQDWLTENDVLTERVGYAFDKAILYNDEENWEYEIPENNEGGTL